MLFNRCWMFRNAHNCCMLQGFHSDNKASQFGRNDLLHSYSNCVTCSQTVSVGVTVILSLLPFFARYSLEITESFVLFGPC